MTGMNVYGRYSDNLGQSFIETWEINLTVHKSATFSER